MHHDRILRLFQELDQVVAVLSDDREAVNRMTDIRKTAANLLYENEVSMFRELENLLFGLRNVLAHRTMTPVELASIIIPILADYRRLKRSIMSTFEFSMQVLKDAELIFHVSSFNGYDDTGYAKYADHSSIDKIVLKKRETQKEVFESDMFKRFGLRRYSSSRIIDYGLSTAGEVMLITERAERQALVFRESLSDSPKVIDVAACKDVWGGIREVEKRGIMTDRELDGLRARMLVGVPVKKTYHK